MRPKRVPYSSRSVWESSQEEGGTAPTRKPPQAGSQFRPANNKPVDHPGAQHHIAPGMVAEKPGWSGGEFVFRRRAGSLGDMSQSGHDGMLPRSPIFVRSNCPNFTLGWEPCPQETVRTRRNPSVTVINPLTHHDLSVMMGESGTSPLVTSPPRPFVTGDFPFRP